MREFNLTTALSPRDHVRTRPPAHARYLPSMPLMDLLSHRRSIKKFTDRPVTRAEIETLLDAAILAPNHRLTEPWRFYVLGPEAREAYGLALGVRKAKKIDDPEASRAMRDRVAAEHRALPCMIAVAVVKSDNPEIAEEDYAAAMMGVQNIMLAAVEQTRFSRKIAILTP